MPNKRYLSGVRAERKLKAKLEAEGWIVFRTAGSHGFFDLIAVHPNTGQVRFMQVKSTKGNIKPLFQQFLANLALPNYNHYTRELWVWKDATWYNWSA